MINIRLSIISHSLSKAGGPNRWTSSRGSEALRGRRDDDYLRFHFLVAGFLKAGDTMQRGPEFGVNEKRVIIVGAGLSGLGAAWE
jgi:hypothetical protein